ncbi:MAG TPA: hypothetical protein VK059_00925 [Nocardioidaceae bacterium]|nr:hypothetical protein [Nocardioidaceae bacterium]
MRTKRLVAVVSGGLLTAAVMTGCGEASDDGGDGGSSGDDYCGMIEDVQGEFSSLEDSDPTLGDLSALSDRLGDIADAAPSEVSDDWKKMDSTLGDMVTALEDAGVDEDKPLQEGVKEVVTEDTSKAGELTESAQAMTQLDTQKLEKNVQEECDIDLGEDS